MPTNAISHAEMMRTMLEDPEIREDWEKTAFARAIARQVIHYRIDHDLSQRELAKRLGVSQGLVGRLELGEHEPRFSTLQMLSRALGIRFSIEIHPEGAEPASGFTTADARVERTIADGVETLVLAS